MSLTARMSATFCAASNDSSFTLNSVFSAAAGLASLTQTRTHHRQRRHRRELEHLGRALHVLRATYSRRCGRRGRRRGRSTREDGHIANVEARLDLGDQVGGLQQGQLGDGLDDSVDLGVRGLGTRRGQLVGGRVRSERPPGQRHGCCPVDAVAGRRRRSIRRLGGRQSTMRETGSSKGPARCPHLLSGAAARTLAVRARAAIMVAARIRPEDLCNRPDAGSNGAGQSQCPINSAIASSCTVTRATGPE